MNKKNIVTYILIIISVVLALTGVAVFEVMQKNNTLKNNTEIVIDGNTSKTLKVEMEGFYPGKTMDYVISLKDKTAQDCSISLNFFDDNGGDLKNYLTVKIVTNKGSIEKSLQDLLDGSEISLGKKINKITISYTMPIETGNESQGTSVLFYIELNAKVVE